VFETKEKELGAMPRCGYKKLGEKMVTKHDKEITQRENAKRIMEFPPGIHTGDGGGFDMQVDFLFKGYCHFGGTLGLFFSDQN
jgi:RIO kinase 3